MLRSSWILNECNLSCKIVKNCRIIGLNRAKKNKMLSKVCMIKKRPHSTVYLRHDEEKYVLKAGLHATRFVAKIYS